MEIVIKMEEQNYSCRKSRRTGTAT